MATCTVQLQHLMSCRADGARTLHYLLLCVRKAGDGGHVLINTFGLILDKRIRLRKMQIEDRLAIARCSLMDRIITFVSLRRVLCHVWLVFGLVVLASFTQLYGQVQRLILRKTDTLRLRRECAQR